MEGDIRKKKRALINDLLKNANKFSFFELVRRLEQVHRDLPRIGESRKLEDDPVRFGQAASLAFAPSSVHSYKRGKSGEVDRLIVNFFGLLGANGPMPLHFTQYVHSRSMTYYDTTLQHFLDIFHHRLISMFYRAWSLNELTVSYDRPYDDDLSFYLGCLLGFFSTPKRDKEFYSRLYWGGRIIGKSPNSEGLAKILSDFFNIPVRIKEFVGSYINIPKQFYLLLGKKTDNCSIGQNTVLGSTFYSITDRFRIILGTLKLSEYEQMLPDKKSFLLFHNWISSYITKALSWEVEYILKPEETPSIKLGSYGQLGFTTWLLSDTVTESLSGLLLSSEHAHYVYSD